MKNLTKRWLSIAAMAMLLVVCAAPVVRAQENATEPQDTPAGQVFRWLNFILIFGALGYFIAKKGSPAFRARANVIAGAIETATAAKQKRISNFAWRKRDSRDWIKTRRRCARRRKEILWRKRTGCGLRRSAKWKKSRTWPRWKSMRRRGWRRLSCEQRRHGWQWRVRRS